MQTSPESSTPEPSKIATFAQFLKTASYSLLLMLLPETEKFSVEQNRRARPVQDGHYVPCLPKPLPEAELVMHSPRLFAELGLSDELVTSREFVAMFSGDLSSLVQRSTTSSAATGKTHGDGEGAAAASSQPEHQHPHGGLGWACPYALSIFGREYYEQDPFFRRNPNVWPDTKGYGDGRAISVHEGVFPLPNSSNPDSNPRQEFQLKGGGQTPFCRSADGRAALRSSVREFLVQEHMAAMGIPTTRSLTLIRSKSETIRRPWYSEGSQSEDPDIVIEEPIAISTRVAPSFLRVGHLELFGRRLRNPASTPQDRRNFELLVRHVVEREYPHLLNKKNNKTDDDDGDESESSGLVTPQLLVRLAEEFRDRHTSVVAGILRVGHIAGNSNGDNCAVGGRVLDYGPFGFVEAYSPAAQSWTGGGEHFAFINQGVAAAKNFQQFVLSIMQLVEPRENNQHVPLSDADKKAAAAARAQLEEIATSSFPRMMQKKTNLMFASKIGFFGPDVDSSVVGPLFAELEQLMRETPADYTILFRLLCSLPSDPKALVSAFYSTPSAFSGLNAHGGPPMHATFASEPERMMGKWGSWLQKWKAELEKQGASPEHISMQMRNTNPKYIAREWMLRDAYRAAEKGNYSLVKELYQVLTQPYAEQPEFESKYFKRRADSAFEVGGISHCSCSS